MSKYYKAEDVISFLNMNCPKDMWEYQIADLPTIEVSEEQLSKLQASENSVENTTASEDFTSISRANSKLEVSEDAISREWLRDVFGLSENTRKWGGDHSGYNTMMLYEIQDYIEDAPSVVPSRSEGEWEQLGIMPRNMMCYEIECSECHSVALSHYTNDFPDFCPYCGAKMKGENE